MICLSLTENIRCFVFWKRCIWGVQPWNIAWRGIGSFVWNDIAQNVRVLSPGEWNNNFAATACLPKQGGFSFSSLWLVLEAKFKKKNFYFCERTGLDMRPFIIICVSHNSLPFLPGVPPTLNGNIQIFWRCLTCYLTKLCHPHLFISYLWLTALYFVPDVQPVSQWIKSSWILDQTLTHTVFLLSTTPLVSNVVQTTQSALGKTPCYCSL